MKKLTFILFFISLIFSQNEYFQQHVAYDIDVTLDDSLHTLSAYEKIEYTNNSSQNLCCIWFHIWPNAYKNNETAFAKQLFDRKSTKFYFSEDDERGYIDSLDFKVNGKKIRWEHHPEWNDVILLNLIDPVKPGETITIETPFFVKIPEYVHRLSHTGKHYEITQWYPKPAVYDNEGWHPMPYLDMGEFYSEFGTFDVKITLPINYRIMATGDLINCEAEYAWLDSLAVEGDKLHNLEDKEYKKAIKELKKTERESSEEMKTVHFHQDNVHDFAWFADPKWIVRKGELKFEKSDRKVTLWSMYLPKVADMWENSIEYLSDATYWYSKFYIEYPYNHVTAVSGDMSAGGAMEYPNITVVSGMPSKDMLETAIMHEVGHNWLYGIIGSNERDHAWLDEGLNTYSEVRYWKKKYGDRGETITILDFIQNKLKIANELTMSWINYFVYNMRAASGDEQPIDISSEEFEYMNYGAMLYYKTAIYTYYLQHYLGEDKMNEIMQEFFDKWKFKHPQPDDLRNAFEKHVDVDLSWYFDDVINSTKTVDYMIKKKGDSFIVENKGEMKIPIEIGFYNKDDELIESNWLDGFVRSTNIDGPIGTSYATIDPTYLLPDLNKTNNSTKKPLNLDFVFDEPDYSKFNINWVPWVFNGNEFNGWSPGLMLYSGFIPTLNYGISIKPMWDFKNNRLVGSAKIQKTFNQLFGFRSLTVSANYSDYEGRKGTKFNFDGLIREPIVSQPATRIKASIYTHKIDRDALASRYYSSGKYLIGDIGFNYFSNPSALLRYTLDAGLTSSFCKNEFSKLYATGNLRWRTSKKGTTYLRGWFGHFLNDKYVPRQYRNYLSGGVDPNFETAFVLNRMKLEDNTLPIVFESQYIEDGAAMRGLAMVGNAPLYSTETSWGLNLTQAIRDVPIEFFADFAGSTDLNDSYFDAGLLINLQSIKIYLPFYQSWDEEAFVKNFDWIKERVRFEIAFDLNSLSF